MIKKQYAPIFSYSEVKNIIENVFNCYNLEQSDEYKENFEKRLNEQWKNWNNGANEHLEEYFFQDEIESFIY